MLAQVDTLLTIGEFSKMTYLSVKALRHYHDVGILEPAHVDPATGYRRYTPAQVPAAQAIRRFRDLDMPLDDVRAVLQAPDLAARNQAILAHLERMHAELDRTRATVESLQALLTTGAGDEAGPRVEVRRLAAASVLTTRALVAFDDAEGWLEPAFTRLHTALERAGLAPAGPDGALYADEFFEEGEGEVTAFVPVAAASTRPGRDQAAAGAAARAPGVDASTLPAAMVAVLRHEGPVSDLDRAYGALGTVVAERGIGARGPIREHYLSEAVTEVCWPVATAAP